MDCIPCGPLRRETGPYYRSKPCWSMSTVWNDVRSGRQVWTRLSELTEKPQLFDEDPFDINQGGIGNCWFISALAALGEYPSHLRDRIFKTKDITPNGCYEICLFEFAERAWKVFEVDDLVPCYKSTSSSA